MLLELFEDRPGDESSPLRRSPRPPPRAVEEELRQWIVTSPEERSRAPAKALDSLRRYHGDCSIDLVHHPKFGWAVIWSWPPGEDVHPAIRIELHPDPPRLRRRA